MSKVGYAIARLAGVFVEDGKPTKWMGVLLMSFAILSAFTLFVITGGFYELVTGYKEEPPAEYKQVTDLYSGGTNMIEDFITSIDYELQKYGVSADSFSLLDYSYNTDNKVIYRLPTENGDTLQLWIYYDDNHVVEYSMMLDSEVIGDGPDGG